MSGLSAVLNGFWIHLIDDDVKHTRDHVLLGRSISCILPAVTVAGPVASFAEQAVPRGPQEEAAALVLAPVDNAERDRYSSLSKAELIETLVMANREADALKHDIELVRRSSQKERRRRMDLTRQLVEMRRCTSELVCYVSLRKKIDSSICKL